MSRHLFIGGHLDGRWMDVPEGRSAWRTIRPTDFSGWSLADESTLDALYFLRRIVVPGWFVPLSVFVVDGLSQPPPGTVLPGFVVGARIDAIEWRGYQP